MQRRQRLLWTAILIGWTLVGLSFTLNYYLFADHYVAIFKEQPSLLQMLVWELPYWFIWAALSPLVFWVSRKFPLERGQRIMHGLMHIFACLFVSAGHRAIYLLVGWLLHVAAYQRLASLQGLYTYLFLFNLPTGFMSYGTILLFSQLVDYYRRHQDEALKISRLKTELAEARLRVAQAQLDALKMQLQPHFLFNTLNSISALLEEDPESADQMLARLGDFLRMTLQNSGAQELSLHEELEFLRCYLDIERVRFQDRLHVVFSIDPETLTARVPNLVLQPLVENAIKHGISKRAGAGVVEIAAHREGSTLLLKVSDDGPGEFQPATGSGVGLANTRARLQQLYGSEHRFDFKQGDRGGFEVTLAIPLDRFPIHEPQPAEV
ncbi:MAG TPA: histidine kinase [Blastocatellia bacterium]|nr:histidine kinase [Blastocatellia bacterium]